MNASAAGKREEATAAKSGTCLIVLATRTEIDELLLVFDKMRVATVLVRTFHKLTQVAVPEE